MRVLLAAICCAMLAGAASSERTVDWSELIDQSALEFEDPFVDLTFDQIDDLRTIARLRDRLEGGTLQDEARLRIEERLSAAAEKLAEQGIDADWLISQRWAVAERRQKAATAGNPEIDGQIVAIAGFAIPGPPDDDGTRIVYLVPERGMCSHMPPPPANQMLRVRLMNDWVPRMMHEPVRLTGRITIDPSEQVMRVIDGMVPMIATFKMEANQAETVEGLLASDTAPDDGTVSE